MILGGHKDIKLCINRMSKYNKTKKIKKNNKSIKRINKKIKSRRSKKHIKKIRGGNEHHQQRLDRRDELQTLFEDVANNENMEYEDKRNDLLQYRHEAQQLDNYFINLNQSQHYLADTEEHLNDAMNGLDEAQQQLENPNGMIINNNRTVTLPNNNRYQNNSNNNNDRMSVMGPNNY